MEGKQANNAWRVLILLFLANLLNYYDRVIPAIVAEPVRQEWGLSDFQIGLVFSAFTVVYAIAGLPLGRLGDTGSRKLIMGWGLVAWSAFTGATALAWSYLSFFGIRMFVGVGEASFAPAATSLIGDMFPPNKRSRAMGILTLGVPIGLVLAFFTVGPMVKAFGSWRAPFLIATVPGLLLVAAIFFIKEPVRGAAEEGKVGEHKIDRPIRRVLRVPTLWWLTLAGIAFAMGSNAAGSFLVPLLQRYFELSLQTAAATTGVIVGLSGLVGLTLGGAVADRLHQINENARLTFGAVSMIVTAALTWGALTLGGTEIVLFTGLFAIGWLFQYNFYVCVYPAIHDVIEPRLRATAVAIFIAAAYILGGSGGPVAIGLLSDHYAHAAMVAAGASQMNEQFKAAGLHAAMVLVPAAMLAAGVALWLANRRFSSDAAAMKSEMALVSSA